MDFDEGSPQPILVGGRVIGFLERVGLVYVGLLGERYDRAEEVVQKLTVEEALSGLLNLVPPETLEQREVAPGRRADNYPAA